MPATKVNVGSGFGGVGTGMATIVAQLALNSQAEAVNFAIENLNSPCFLQEVVLVPGDNEIAVPAKASGVVIVPDQNNDWSVTLKGETVGDAGFALAKRAPSCIMFNDLGLPNHLHLNWPGRSTHKVVTNNTVNPSVFTKNTHRLANGDEVRFYPRIGGALALPIATHSIYTVTVVDPNTFTVAIQCSTVGSQYYELDPTAAGDVVTKKDHGLNDGDRVRFRPAPEAGGALPGGLTEGQLYYIRDKTDDTFKVALTFGGSVVALSTVGNFLVENISVFKLYWL